jgi:hypothetical protein
LAFGDLRRLSFAVAVEFEFSAAHFARIQMTHQAAEALGRPYPQGIDRFELLDLQIAKIHGVKQLPSSFTHGSFRNGDKLGKLSVPITFKAFGEIGINRNNRLP